MMCFPKNGSTFLNDSQLFPVEIAFIEWKNYCKQQEELIDSLRIKSQTHQKEFEDNYKSEDIHGRIFNSLISFRMESEIYIPHSIRCALLVQIFSFFEYELNQICITIGKKIKQEPKGVYIHQSKSFLKNNFNIDITNFKEYKFIDSAREIRNKIVHNQGKIVKSERPKIIEFIEKIESITFFESNIESLKEVTLLLKNEEFNYKILGLMEQFFKKLIDELNQTKTI